jgi:uncharacterized membrane protein
MPRAPKAKTAADRGTRWAKWARLAVAAVVGIAVFFGLPAPDSETIRALLAWDGAVFALLAMVVAMIARGTAAAMRRRAALQDSGRWAILFITVGGAIFSLAALAFAQKSLKAPGGDAALFIPLVVGTIMLSWFLVHTQFALHYAHGYYGPAEDENDADGLVGGLEFPSETAPDYWDFMYFSFVVGMTCQVSDVEISSRALRRMALVHGIIAFFFNTIILALTINIVASVM